MQTKHETRVPVFQLNGTYFASPDSSTKDLASDVSCILSVVEDTLRHVAMEIEADDSAGIDPTTTSQILFGMKYLTRFAFGINAEIERREFRK